MEYLEIKKQIIENYEGSKSHNDKRFFAICLTGLQTGARISDLIKLEWSNFDFKTNVLSFRNTKSKKKQNQLFGNDLRAVLLDLKNESFRMYGIQKEAFYNDKTKDNKVSRVSITRRCSKDFGFSFHEFRRISAKNVANQKGVVKASSFLGHSRVSTTDIYLNSSMDNYLEEMRDCII